jgi:hypothetical protein
LRRTILLTASVAAALILATGIALAAYEDMPDTGIVGTNGRVNDILRAGDMIYLAGSFTQIVLPDGTTVPRNNLAAIDATTGQLTDWDPNVTNLSGNSSVLKMALSANGTRLFIGGNFAKVGGLWRVRLAAIDPVTGAVEKGWRADVNDGTVYALSVSADKLYLGGSFTSVAGEPRERLAAVDTSAGTLDPNWRPTASRDFDTQSASVRAMDVSPDSTRVYVGGLFSHINHVWTRKLAAIDADTGNLYATFAPATPNTILDMDIAHGQVYVGTGDLLEGIEAFDVETGQLGWSIEGGHPDPQAGDVQAIIASGDKVYAGGHFGQMGGLVRTRLVEVDAQTGQIGPWAPPVVGTAQTWGCGRWRSTRLRDACTRGATSPRSAALRSSASRGSARSRIAPLQAPRPTTP